MTLWTILTPPLMAALLLFSLFPILLSSLIFAVQSSSITILEWDFFSSSTTHLLTPLLLDKTSLLFSLTVVTISFSVMLFSTSYMSGDPNLEYFIIMVLLFVLSMNLLIFIPNIIMLLLGWDGLGLTSYLLVIYYQNSKSLAAGMITAMTNRIGDALLILAGGWALGLGHWNFLITPLKITFTLALLLTVAAMTKSAQLPFSAWLPAAMAAPTPVSSLVHSSTLVTAGVYLLIRFFPSLSTFPPLVSFLFYSGTMTCMMAGMAANFEFDLKKVIALSTLSQLGVMMMALGLGQPTLALFHLITHALFKALLFICAGTIIHHQQNTQDLRLMGNLWSTMPTTCTALNVANLALCGFPFMAGFYSKDLIIETFLMTSYPISTSLLLISTICLTAAYSMRLSLLTLWTPSKNAPLSNTPDQATFTQIPSFILLVGAVTSGPILAWALLPSLNLIVLPLPMKTMALTLITAFALTAYWSFYTTYATPILHFMSTMWFLGFITSSPTNALTMKLGDSLYISEMTWLEILSGKGALHATTALTLPPQQAQGMSFPQMFSIFSALTILCLMWL